MVKRGEDSRRENGDLRGLVFSVPATTYVGARFHLHMLGEASGKAYPGAEDLEDKGVAFLNQLDSPADTNPHCFQPVQVLGFGYAVDQGAITYM
jgi:hypothetical protein